VPTDFKSLLIVMGTTGVTMLVVGPAIYQLSDPTNPHLSVLSQTMDQLLPKPLPYLGTLMGIAVLMSASAASAQGLRNLALGLRERHYIPRSRRSGHLRGAGRRGAGVAASQVDFFVICSIL